MKQWALSLLLLFTSCGSNAPQKPIVLVSVSPYQTILKEIAGDTIDVFPIVPVGFNPHLFEPSPKDAMRCEHATLLFGIGEVFEHKLTKVISQENPSFVYVNLTQSLPYLIYEDHHHEHDSHSHDAAYDVHIWMDPVLMSIQVDTIEKCLSKAFPEHQRVYAQNAETLKNRLDRLNITLKEILAPYANTSVVLSHPSLAYFCKQYHLNQMTLEIEGKEPLPKELERILGQIESTSVRCVFVQAGFNNKGAAIVAEKLHLPIYTIDPNAPDYENNLQKIAKEIAGLS
ncbi:MAG: zinc ABC transporter substrate-binding protein [Chlamydiales bacterium]|nr:zinc ABC transporter substrate-binding protein [Chlamydiales bacterium]